MIRGAFRQLPTESGHRSIDQPVGITQWKWSPDLTLQRFAQRAFNNLAILSDPIIACPFHAGKDLI